MSLSRLSGLSAGLSLMSKCKFCKQPATQKFGLNYFCNSECAYNQIRANIIKRADIDAKERRKRDRELLKKLKTRSEWLRDAQVIFNRFIRLRDAGNPCISCGRNSGAKMNAGHYLSVGAHPELRFNEFNVHLQCEHCNSYRSGNQAEYRPRLITKIGLTEVERLEGPQEPLKLAIPEIQALIATYKNKCKILLNSD